MIDGKRPRAAAEDPLENAMREALAAQGRVPVPPDAAALPSGGPGDPLDAIFGRALMPPESADQYDIRIPRGIDRDAALETEARRWFHEAGLPQGLVNGIVEAYCRCLASESPAADAEAGARAELAREWGPDCERRIARAQSIIARCRDRAAIADILGTTGLGNDAWLVRSLAALADADSAADPEGARA